MAQSHQHQTTKNIRLAFFLNLGFTILEIIGGIAVNSVSIISDAIHDLGDSISLGLAWYLENKSQKKPTEKFTFGYYRFSLLGALINSVILIAGSVFVVSQAIERIQNPEPSNAQGMLIFALIGIAVNGYAAWKTSGSSSLNQRVVSWHLLEDVLGWFAVLVASIIMLFTDSQLIDPILSLLISVFILVGVFRSLKETLYLFLQGVPEDIDLKKICSDLEQIEHVESQHHTHIWSLDGEHNVFSSHLRLKEITNLNQLEGVKQQAKLVLEPYHFDHITLETELNEMDCSLQSADC